VLLRLLLDTPIRAKAFAASFVLLLCLVGIGITAYVTLDKSTEGLTQLRGNLPTQNAVSRLTGDVIATHVKLFRRVTWGSNGVSPALLTALSGEIRTDLTALGEQFQTLASLPLSHSEHVNRTTLSVAWEKYDRVARDTLEVAASDAPMGAMKLGGIEDDFQLVLHELRTLSSLVTARTDRVARNLTDQAVSMKWILALGGIAGIIISAVVTLLVAGTIVAPIRTVTLAMSQISTGDTDLELAGGERKDEIGQMVQAITVFRHSMQQQREELRTQNQRFDAALNNMSQGLAMFDHTRRLIVCNKRYKEVYGLSPQLTPCDASAALATPALRRNRAPTSPSADSIDRLEGAESNAYEIELDNGRVVYVLEQPMEGGGWLSTHEDVTERHHLQARLTQQNEQLDAALNNVKQGIAMFDREQRLVVCNARYLATYGFAREDVRPGMTLREIIELRIRMGLLSDKTPDEIIEAMHTQRGDANSEQFYSHLSDGRYIAIAAQPMAAGGTVTTHEDVTERRRAEAQIAHMAHHDALTELPNRVLLRERLEQALAGGSGALAVFCLDLDRFKEVNDTLGHSIGDALLKMVSERLRHCLSAEDTAARLGGDEFAVVAMAAARLEDATLLATRIIDELSRPYDLDGHQIVIGISVGIAFSPSDGFDADQLLRNADLALYRAKAEGKGTFRVFERGMGSLMTARRALDLELRKALVNGEFELVYQPVINLDSNAVLGFEALLRWNHPQRGLIEPAEFVPLAEETGLIVSIGQWVLRQACAEAVTWPDHIGVAVNLSAVQLKASNLVRTVFNTLAVSGLAPRRLELEVTESVLIRDGEQAVAALCELRDLGVRIALDDFGKGYSSLSYLRTFPLDRIKIDRSFVKDLTAGDAASLAIVRAVAQLGATFGLRTTAEGVESEEQLELVRTEGCTDVQGFLFGPPRSAAELAHLHLSVLASSHRAA